MYGFDVSHEISVLVPSWYGILRMVANPATTDPPLPGLVWAVESRGDLYYLLDWDTNDFMWSYDDILKYGSFSEGQRVKVIGVFETRYDIYGKPYYIIIVQEITAEVSWLPVVAVIGGLVVFAVIFGR